MDSTVIEAKNITKVYLSGDEELKALDDVSFTVKSGDFLALLGPSGSGKSTLMNIIGCLDIPTSGEYYLDGIDVLTADDNQLAEIRNQKIGFIFQKFNLMPRLSAWQNVMLPLLYRGMNEKEAKEQSLEALTSLGLENRMKHLPSQLSGGQQQRVAIARAIVGKPHLLLADEPTGNLDSKSGEEAISIFIELNNKGHTILLITHDNEVAKQAQRTVSIRDGRLY